MQDTRETLVRNLTLERVPADNECGEDIPPEMRPQPRFRVGDIVLHPLAENPLIVRSVYWDYEFGGWLVAVASIGMHESNFVLETERDLWEPHKGGLWSYWTRRC